MSIRPVTVDTAWRWETPEGGTIYIASAGGVGPTGGAGPPGTTDHALLTNLDFASANHTGFAGLAVENTFTEKVTINASAATVLEFTTPITGQPRTIFWNDGSSGYATISGHGQDAGYEIDIVSFDGTSLAQLSIRASFPGSLHVGSMTFSPDDATQIPLVVQAHSGQTANLAEVQLSNGTPVVSIGPTGAITLDVPLPIASGGTNAGTTSDAINNLLPDQTGNSGKVLTTDGSDVSWEAGGGSFDGLITDDLVAHYVADPAYCFSDSGGTTPCGDDDPIQVWKSVGGLGADYVQSTSGKRAVLKLVGGRWFARFDNSDDGYPGGGVSLSLPYTIFLSGRHGASTGSGRRTVASSTANLLVTLTDRTDVSRWYMDGAVGPTGGSAPEGKWVSVGVVANSSQSVAYLNSRDYTQNIVAGISWGTVHLAAHGGTNSEPADCDLRHILAYDVALTPAQVLQLHLWAGAS